MTELWYEHLEVITKNKIWAHEEQKNIRDELAFFVMNCTQFQMQELYSEMKRMKRRYGEDKKSSEWRDD